MRAQVLFCIKEVYKVIMKTFHLPEPAAAAMYEYRPVARGQCSFLFRDIFPLSEFQYIVLDHGKETFVSFTCPPCEMTSALCQRVGVKSRQKRPASITKRGKQPVPLGKQLVYCFRIQPPFKGCPFPLGYGIKPVLPAGVEYEHVCFRRGRNG